MICGYRKGDFMISRFGMKLRNLVIKNKNIGILILFAITPFLCCEIMCVMNGITIKEVFLPNSVWNDELIYFKEVDGIINAGWVKGLFGYNESYAKVGNLSTWSPMLLIFWATFGKIFGWNILSPIICNILLMTIALVVFVILVKPNIKQTISILLLFFSFQVITRFTLSNLPEISCYFLLIIFLAIMIDMGKSHKVFLLKIVFLFLISIIITLMRPYYLLLFFVPTYFAYQRYRWKGLLSGAMIAAFTVSTYYLMSTNMQAPYFIPLFNTEWLKILLCNPLMGIGNVIKILINAMKEFMNYIGEGIITGNLQGAFCCAYLVILVCYLKKVSEIKDKNNITRKIYLFFIAFMVVLFIASALFFDVRNGSKHFAEFVVIGIFLIGFDTETRRNKWVVMIFFWLFVVRAINGYDWMIPARTDDMVFELQEGTSQMESTLDLNDNGIDEWDSTIIWVLEEVKWQDIYAVPAGYGINICNSSYVISNFEEIMSKYLLTSFDSELYNMCVNSKKQLIAQYGAVCLWKLRE